MARIDDDDVYVRDTHGLRRIFTADPGNSRYRIAIIAISRFLLLCSIDSIRILHFSFCQPFRNNPRR
jgi:hypothetical protein